MPRKKPKSAVVAFKVEEELATLLNDLPNKSDFIRKAIIAQLGLACPVCHGSGVVSRGLHDHYRKLLPRLNSLACDGCGTAESLPADTDTGDLSAEHRRRLEQFFHGGPLYCDSCYVKAPVCHDCDWHIATEKAAEHQRVAHEGSLVSGPAGQTG